MKKLLFLFFVLFAFLSIAAQDFTVEKFHCDVTINKDGSFDVIENYDVIFAVPKHGITRDIITNYEFTDVHGIITQKKVDFTNVEVSGHPFKRSPKIVEKFGGMMNLKIGDSHRLVTDDQHYEIKYRVLNGLFREDSITQFYWNIKPSGWHSNFKNVEFKIHTPENFIPSTENSFTYSGDARNDENSKDFNYSFENGIYSGSSISDFISHEGQSVTILIKMPNSLFQEAILPSNTKKNMIWIGVLLAILAAFGFFWRRFGRDTRVPTITSYYPPNGIDPALAGYLMDDDFKTNHLIALIPKWGAEGLLKMKEIPKSGWLGSNDLELTKLGSLPAGRPNYEQTIFNGLFGGIGFAFGIADLLKNQGLEALKNLGGQTVITSQTSVSFTDDDGQMMQINPNVVKMSSLKNTFYQTLHLAEEQLKAKTTNYYEITGEKAKLISITLTILLSLVVPAVFLFRFGFIAAIVSFIFCLMLVFLSFTMRKKNPKGDQAYAELKGFYQFVKIADVSRIKALIAEDPNYFEKTMSYALAFGLLKKWASKFEGLLTTPPQFYTGATTFSSGNAFRMSYFTQSFSSSMQTASAAMVSSPTRSGSSSSGSSSSSGGGHSGGGGGGGGGGSW